MTLVRWKPTNVMAGMPRDLGRVFNEFFGLPTMTSDLLERDWVPAVDIYENDNEINVQAELPGLSTEDVSITI